MRVRRWRAAWLVRQAVEKSIPYLDTLERGIGEDGAVRALVIELATEDRHAEHPLRLWARDRIARTWVRGRDPALRAVVREHRLMAAGGDEHWTTAALNDRLLESWGLDAETALPALLTDDDPDVRGGARRACAQAREPLLGVLWAQAKASLGAEREPLLESLLGNPHPLDDRTLGLAWSTWIESPEPALWAFLRERGGPATDAGGAVTRRLSRLALGTAPPEELCRSVLDDGPPEHVREIVVRTCAERGLVPAEPPARAAFLLVTGRYEEYRLLDPDGSLLAAAYAAGPAGLRDRVRSAIAAAGELDLLRVLIDATSVRTMSVRERGLLADRLAAEEAWPKLWRLARDLPLAEAIGALRAVPGRPPPGLPPAAFDRLRRMPPHRVAAALASLDAPAPVRLEHGLLLPGDHALSPDGTRIAVEGYSRDAGAEVVVEYTLPEGEVVARHRKAHAEGPVHAGDAVFGIAGRPERVSGRVHGDVVRYGGGGEPASVLGPRRGDRPIWALAAAPSGLVAASPDGLYLLAPPYDRPHRTVRFADLGLPPVPPFTLAVEWTTGMIAVGGAAPAVLDAAAETVIARGDAVSSGAVQVAFASPSRLITRNRDGSCTGWAIAHGMLRPEPTALAGKPGQRITALPAHDRLWAGRYAGFFDPATLEQAGPPAGGGLADVRALWAAPAGAHFAIVREETSAVRKGHEDDVEVYGTYRDPAGRMLDRPLADFAPADLDRIDALIASGKYDGDVAELLALHRIFLEERYGSDVALGTAVPLGDETDIALGDATGTALGEGADPALGP
ncbi:hypothetical protein AB0L25_14110 [Spirillospora sp. NPDC052242]